MLVEAFAVMLGATFAVHMGLSTAIAEVASKVASCNMCLSFWCCLIVLAVFYGYDILVSAIASLAMAYLSNWVVILAGVLQRAYTHIYNKVYGKEE